MTPASMPLPYRPDIDGLRAIAILLVVACHVGVPGLAGGFVGVDVFFVISGYLIIGLLVGERRDTGHVAIANFYARRARRLLPVLCTVILVTLALGSLVLLPDAQVDLARSGLAGLGFVANVYFWKAGQNYFADSAAVMPLQHLWTLSVEEQFYIAAPFVLSMLAAVAARTGRRSVTVIAGAIIAVTIASLLLAIIGAMRFPAAAFMLTPTRAWELGLGGLLAMGASERWPGQLAVPSTGIGLLAIAAAGLLFDDTTPYPSWRALLPVAGSMLVIMGGTVAPRAIVSRALASRPMVAIGKLSYGWYLWHWPLLALARSRWGTDPAPWRDGAIALVALGLAALSYQWLEMPIKRGRVVAVRSTHGALAGGGALVFASAVACGCLWAWGNRPAPHGSILAQYLNAQRGAERDFKFCDGNANAPDCSFGRHDGDVTILLWGDSHAAFLSVGLDQAASRAGIRVLARTKSSCQPNLMNADWGVRSTPVRRRACAAFNRALLATLPSLQREQHLRGVVIAGNWDQRDLHLAAALTMIVERIRSVGLKVVLARDIPQQPFDFAACVTWRDPAGCKISRARVERDQKVVGTVLTRIAMERSNVIVWSPLDTLCPAGQCTAVANGQLLYRNPWHLNRAGSALLAPAMAEMTMWLSKPALP